MVFHGALHAGKSHGGGAFKKVRLVCGFGGCLADNVVNGTPDELGWYYDIAYMCRVDVKGGFDSEAVHDRQCFPELVDTGVVVSNGDRAVFSILPYGNLCNPFVILSKTTSGKDDRQAEKEDINASHKFWFGII